MLTLLIGRDWLANTEEIFRRIAQDVHSRKGNLILLVPELISHESERMLCATAGDTSSRYAEVLSFTRLVRRVSDYSGTPVFPCLDNGGRIVALAAVSRQFSSRLKAYAAVETKPEFLTGLMDAIDEFKRCCITSQDLREASNALEGSVAQKLEELALIMEGYDSLCTRGKRDPRDQMSWLLEQLEDCSFGEDHTFYIDGFPDFTRQNMAILEHLIKTAPNVTVSLTCDRIGSTLLAFEKAGYTAQEILRCAQKAGIEVSVEIVPETNSPLNETKDKLFQGTITNGTGAPMLQTFHCDSPFQECMSAVHEVLELVRNGSRYRDIAIVCTDLNIYKPFLEMIFHRYSLPLYCSGTEPILQKSVISTVLTALESAQSGFDSKNMLRYLRSPLSPMDPDTCDMLENYIVMWGIRGQKWTQNWENHPEGLGLPWEETHRKYLSMLNEARNMAVLPLVHLRDGFLRAVNVQEQVVSIYRFLEEIHLEERLTLLAQDMDDSGDHPGAQVLNQLWEILLSALEQLHDALGETKWDGEHFSRLFRLLLSQYDVGTIPPVLDAVQAGGISAMRCNQQKHLMILGAEEGKLPGYTGSSGILTDQERVALRNLGVPLTGGAVEGIQAEFAEIYGVFCGATSTIRIYFSGDQPSFVMRRLASLSGGIRESSNALGYALADSFEAGAYLSRWNAESEADRLRISDDYRTVISRRDYAMGTVARDSVSKLYGSTLNLSASQIDRFAECRLSYFLKYGLRVRERKEITVDPAEFGTYVHAVLENTAQCVQQMGGFHVVSLEETMKIAHRYSEEYAAERFSQLESERMIFLFRRNIQELDMIVEELWQELKDSQFEPVGFEVNFGSTDGLPPISIPNNSMNALLRGFIDRVDVWKTTGSSYYRVVDYKTGKKDFDYCDVFNGVGLQMLLYLFALRGSGASYLGNRPVPAGVQYFPARAPYIPTEGMIDDTSTEKERRPQWKRRGLLLEDESVLQAMEPGEQPTRMCYSVKKDGTYSGDLADRDQLKLLERYVFSILGRMVDEIASGSVEPNPYTRGSSHNACAFCPYDRICHEASVENRRNYKAMSAQKFWEEIGKEMD